MISDKCSIEDFLREVDGCRRLEAIHLANLEITEAERRLLSLRTSSGDNSATNPDYGDYSESLKQFIRFVRYSVRPKLADHTRDHLFRSYLESAPSESESRLH